LLARDTYHYWVGRHALERRRNPWSGTGDRRIENCFPMPVPI